MPLTSDQLDNWFTYHPPTADTAPKYAEIRATEQEAVRACIAAVTDPEGGPAAKRCALVNQATRCFVEVIDANAPDSADKTAAIRCVRLMRNAANEAVMLAASQSADPVQANTLFQVIVTEAWKARWQANSAIACGGK